MNQSNHPYEKTTTFSKSPGIAQVASYLVFTLMVAVFYSVILPNLATSSTALAILFTISLSIMIITTVATSCTDPSDQAMILYRNQRQEFQEWKQTSEGRLLFCDYCQSFVKQKSRHCRTCDRCVEQFDHHCMWINNCIGSQNYRWFFAMILASFSTLTIYLITIIILTSEGQYNTFLTGFIFAWISGAINAVLAFLLLNLILLHVYLMAKGISTYEFIVAQREEDRKGREQEQMKKKIKGSDTQKIVPEELVQKREDEGSHVSISVKGRNPHNQSEDRAISRDHEPKMIRVGRHHNSDEGKEHSSSGKEHSSQQRNSVIFGEKEEVSKSHCSEKQSEGEVEEEGEYESEDTVKMSSLFLRNKSLKLILGKNEFHRPKARRPKERLKMQSMLV